MATSRIFLITGILLLTAACTTVTNHASASDHRNGYYSDTGNTVPSYGAYGEKNESSFVPVEAIVVPDAPGVHYDLIVLTTKQVVRHVEPKCNSPGTEGHSNS